MDINEFLRDFERWYGRMPSIGFLGLGKSNLALLRAIDKPESYCITLRSHAMTRIPIEGGRILLGEDATADICEDILFLSPSVRRDTPQLAAAALRGVIFSSDCELFFDGGEHTCFTVTGSDGKSTVTSLIGAMLENATRPVLVGGNIGTPLSSLPHHDRAVYVSELSSFQLMYTAPRSLRCVITNITENHLNWHSSFAEYRAAKMNILKHTAGAVLSADDAECARIAEDIRPHGVFSLKMSCEELMRRFSPTHAVSLCQGFICLDGEPVVATCELLRGEDYNILNMMAAIAAVADYADREQIALVCRSFRGLDHRAQLFHSCGGIDFIDSSIDTTPTRSAKTLAALSRRVRIILGGRGKGLSPLPLKEPLLKYADRIALYGEAGGEYLGFIEKCQELCRIPHSLLDRFSDAVDYILCDLRGGDTVLLSPGATGYGEFRDFAHRGEFFKEYVRDRFPTNTAARSAD